MIKYRSRVKAWSFFWGTIYCSGLVFEIIAFGNTAWFSLVLCVIAFCLTVYCLDKFLCEMKLPTLPRETKPERQTLEISLRNEGYCRYVGSHEVVSKKAAVFQLDRQSEEQTILATSEITEHENYRFWDFGLYRLVSRADKSTWVAYVK